MNFKCSLSYTIRILNEWISVQTNTLDILMHFPLLCCCVTGVCSVACAEYRSTFKVLAKLVSTELSPLGLQMAISSPCPF